MFIVKNLVVLCVSVSIAGINLAWSGSMTRKERQKIDFFDEITNLPAINIKAVIERAPDSYVDSTAWNVESVVRLTALLHQSKKAENVVQHLHQIMPQRRFMKYTDSLKVFPSLSQDHVNNFYYDIDVAAQENDQQDAAWAPGLNADNSVIVITNPSEARLPADTISVKLLRETMEARAKAARFTPSTTTLMWKPKT